MPVDLLGPAVGALLGVLGTKAFDALSARSKRSTGLGQIRYYLRDLEVQMSVVRYFPINHLDGYEHVLPRLIEVAMSNEGAASITAAVREQVYDAIHETERSLAFLQWDNERMRNGGSEETEYRIAAARRALRKIYIARRAVNDDIPVKYPPDPRALHNWRPSTEIPRDKDML